MKKICIVNAHWSNRGDEAATRALLDVLRQKSPESTWEIIFKDKKEITCFPYEDVAYYSAAFLPKGYWHMMIAVASKGRFCTTNADMQRTIRSLSEADAIIYAPGGAVICDRFWWVKQLEYLLPSVCAHMYHKPMAIAAPSMGPFDNNKSWQNRILKKYIDKMSVLCVREEISCQYLEKLKCHTKAVTTIDTAFLDDPDKEYQEKIFSKDVALKAFFEKHQAKKIVGMTLTDLSWNVKYINQDDTRENAKEVMQDFIAQLKEDGYAIILIPQLFGNQNDRDLLLAYEDETTFVLSDIYDTYFQQYLISRLYAVVGMRYHSNIFAAKVATPFLAISYEEKMMGFMEGYGLQDYCVGIEQLDKQSLQKAWRHLERTHQDYKKQLQDYRKIWRDRAQVTIDQVVQCLT